MCLCCWLNVPAFLAKTVWSRGQDTALGFGRLGPSIPSAGGPGQVDACLIGARHEARGCLSGSVLSMQARPPLIPSSPLKSELDPSKFV